MAEPEMTPKPRRTQPTLTAERLREVLYYEAETGKFRWAKQLSSRGVIGAVAGYLSPHGYIRILIDGRGHYAHRLVWLYVHGRFPNSDLDHANNIKTDNRVSNIRLASRSENQCNRFKPKHNTSGYKGVSRDRRNGRWRAAICVNGKTTPLGSYVDKEAAYAAYVAGAERLHGKFANP